MARAVAEGIPKLRIEECAARRQARIDSGTLLQLIYQEFLVYCCNREFFPCIGLTSLDNHIPDLFV